MGNRFVKICEHLFPGKSRAYIAERLGTSNEGRVRLFESGSIPETAVLNMLDRLGISLEWFLINKGSMLGGRDGAEAAGPAAGGSAPRFKAGSHRPNAERWSSEIPFRHPLSIAIVGEAAGDSSHGSLAGGFGEDDRTVWDSVEIPRSARMVKIKGDSMSPLILPDQYVIVGDEYPPGRITEGREIVVAEIRTEDDEFSAVDKRWDGVYCKRVSDEGDYWLFQSISASGDNFTIPKGYCRLWPVIGIWFAGHGKPPQED